MPLELDPISYADLNARQKESYNFQKVSAVLADYGFTTIRLSDDWHGADFIAQHVDGAFLKVQLKGRLTFDQKYRGKDLHVAFGDAGTWYLYPHDELLDAVLASTSVEGTKSWQELGGYSFARLSGNVQRLVAPYQIAAAQA